MAPTDAKAARGTGGRSAKGAARPPRGRTAEAGAGATDQEMTRQVACQTSSDRAVETFFERERDGAVNDVEAAKVRADQLT
ncbi:hypothetical protein I6A84_16670 [Frankia sp. CNm7]|uniref:Uncharacterized protein n=1 Tax=Frankia nepalensis TaxID=1836974 RepID=A0A937RB52_9ACTN|nr:hypothetical protein [Frankia nepalensis]MBL7516317.1 hypothetical protein [Frankia nepalensis]MBL7519687.1 hypothetical protein [Frankia nepalensis]MBL7625765.1 hypothetical protein [Frankia nepalensis]